MSIIGCTKENNCKRDAFLKARQVEAEYTTGTLHFYSITWQSNNTYWCENIVSHNIPKWIKIHYFTMGLESPHKQEESTDPKIRNATVSSDVTPDLSGNPNDTARHTSGNKHLDGQSVTLEEQDALKDSVEIP